MSCLCFSVGGDLKTKIRNETQIAIDLQIRVGSLMKKAYCVKPGRSKTIDCRKIYRTYGLPSRASVNGSWMPYQNQICQPYVWIHNPSDFTRLVKQQYLSLEDLRDHSLIKVCRDPRKATFAVLKIPRSEFC